MLHLANMMQYDDDFDDYNIENMRNINKKKEAERERARKVEILQKSGEKREGGEQEEDEDEDEGFDIVENQLEKMDTDDRIDY